VEVTTIVIYECKTCRTVFAHKEQCPKCESPLSNCVGETVREYRNPWWQVWKTHVWHEPVI